MSAYENIERIDIGSSGAILVSVNADWRLIRVDGEFGYFELTTEKANRLAAALSAACEKIEPRTASVGVSVET